MSELPGVLLTGVTGFLGSAVAWELASAGHPVLAVVRKNSRRSARAWLKERTDVGAAGKRIRLLTGDLTAPDVLDERGLARARADASIVVHCAAATDPAVDRAYAYAVNVDGTANLARLARSLPSLQRFVHVSDLAVAGDHRGVFAESDLLVDQGFAGAYAESKMVAERQLRSAGVPRLVLRPSALLGTGFGGPVPRVTPVLRLLSALVRISRAPRPLRRLPVLPFGGCARVDAVPVDWAARVVARLAVHDGLEGQTLHLSDPDAPTLRELVDAAGAKLGLGRSGPNLPRRVMKPLWASGPMTPVRALFDQAWNLPDPTLAAMARCAVADSQGAASLLRPLGLEAPSLLDGLDDVLEYVRSSLV